MIVTCAAPNFPAIDLARSSTRKEELLLKEDQLEAMWMIRKAIQDSPDFVERFIRRFKQTKNNEELYQSIFEELKRKNKN